MDLGQFGKWDETQTVLENLARIPSGFSPKPGAKGPTEMLPMLTSMESLKGTLERSQFEAMRANLRERTYYGDKIASQLGWAIDNNDMKHWQDTMDDMIHQGMLPPDMGEKLKGTMMDRSLPRLLRDTMENQRDLINNLEDMQQLQQMQMLMTR